MILKERFLARVYPEPNTGCWLWAGAVQSFGHGVISEKTYSESKAHRYSYMIHKGHIDKGKCVLHTCDVPSCVNPDHLYIGDKTQNARDRKNRGRNGNHKGTKNGRSILDEDKVLKIRSEYEYKKVTAKMLSDKYSISIPVILQIVKNKAWKHL